MPTSGFAVGERLTAPHRAFPVPAETDDRRFEQLARDVGLVIEQHGYPRVNGADRTDLAAVLYEFLHVPRDAAERLVAMRDAIAEGTGDGT